MIKSIEDCLELLVGLQDDPNNEFKVNEVDGTILSSIGRQVCKGVALTDRQLEVVKNKLATTYRSQFKNYKEFSALNSTFQPPHDKNAKKQIKVLRDYIQKWNGSGGNLVLVTHYEIITSITDVVPRSGEIIIMSWTCSNI